MCFSTKLAQYSTSNYGRINNSSLIKRCPVDQTQQTQEPVSEQKNKESE